MPDPHLQVRDSLGERDVALDHFPFTIGRRDTNDLRLGGSEVSREHAEITSGAEGIVLRDRSRGTARSSTAIRSPPSAHCARVIASGSGVAAERT